MTKTYQWYYDGSAIGGATSKTHTLTSGQTDSNLIECKVTADYGTDSVGALAEYGGFVEERVQANGATYLTATSTPSNTAQIMFFVKIEPVGASGRSYVFCVDGANGEGVFAPFIDNTSFAGGNLKITDTDTSAVISNASYPDDEVLSAPLSGPISYLGTIDITGGTGSGIVRHWRYYNGSWTQLYSSTDRTFSTGTLIKINGGATRMLARNTDGAQNYGKNNDVISRAAFWTGISPNIDNVSERDNFVNSATGDMIDPATSQAAYSSGTLLFDFYKLAHWNLAETPDGTLSWTKTGSDLVLDT